MRNILGLALGLWLAAVNGVAMAQPAAEKAAADTLFKEGKKQIDKGNPTDACPFFEASLRKAVQLGTQLALAKCYETIGKTASAWGQFRAAASTAAKAHDKRQRYAEEHATALESKLSKVVLRVEPGYRVDGLEIKRDGIAVSAAELGTAIPVDPGEYTIEASAPGWVTWSSKLSVVSPGVIELIVPVLGKAPVKIETAIDKVPEKPVGTEPTAAAAVPPTQDTTRQRRLLAYGVGVGGAGMIGVSLIVGAIASSRWTDAQNHCHQNRCDPTGIDLAHRAQSMGNVSTGIFVVGVAALATGAVLYLTARPTDAETRPSPRALRVLPGGAMEPIGVTLQGGF
jgi:hypothetical protein